MDVQLSKVSIEKEFTTILMSYIEDDNIKFFNKKMKFYVWKGFQNDFIFVTIHIVQHV